METTFTIVFKKKDSNGQVKSVREVEILEDGSIIDRVQEGKKISGKEMLSIIENSMTGYTSDDILLIDDE